MPIPTPCVVAEDPAPPALDQFGGQPIRALAEAPEAMALDGRYRCDVY